MAWTAPITFVGNQTLTSTVMNTYLRDNLLELAPAKATTQSSFFIGAAANSLVERKVAGKRVNTSQGTTSNTYTDLATSGPSVTLSTGVNAIVIIAAFMSQSINSGFAGMTWASSGATTNAASDTWSLQLEGVKAGNPVSACSWYRTNSLNAGTNTFTAKYRRSSAGGTATFANRIIIVLPV